MPRTDTVPGSIAESFGSSICYGIIRNMTYLDHAHPEYEMLFVLEGQVEVFAAGGRYRLSAGNFIFIREYTLHSYASQPGSLSLIIGCSPERVPQFTRIFQKNGAPSCMFLQTHFALRSIIHSLLSDPLAEHSYVALVGYVDLLLSHVAAGLQGYPPCPLQPPGALDRAIIQVDCVLPANVNAQEIAKAAGISVSHLSRLFSRKLGVSFSAYVSLVQINAARRMLVQTDLSVREVCIRCGYRNPRTFDRAFLRLVGMPPREYRRRNQPGHIIDYDTPFVRDLLLERYRSLQPAVAKKPASQKISHKYE